MEDWEKMVKENGPGENAPEEQKQLWLKATAVMRPYLERMNATSEAMQKELLRISDEYNRKQANQQDQQ